ncbi:MAG: PilZ domain-containing protein [Idiomarina sp.]
MSDYRLNFSNEEQVRKAYMPFVQQGGLFVATGKRQVQHQLGDQVMLSVTLPKDTEATLVKGKVVWLSPPRGSAHSEAGFGVQLLEDKSHLRNRIETLLGHLVQSDAPTSTI